MGAAAYVSFSTSLVHTVPSPVALDCLIENFSRHVARLCHHLFACTYALKHACMLKMVSLKMVLEIYCANALPACDLALATSMVH